MAIESKPSNSRSESPPALQKADPKSEASKAVLCQGYCFATVTIWALTNTFIRMLVPYYTALSMVALRLVFATAAMIIVLAVKKYKLPPVKDLPYFAIAGLTAYISSSATGSLAMSTIDATTCSVIVATSPVFTAIAAFVLFKEKIRPLGWIAIAIEFFGIVLLSYIRGSFTLASGIIFAFVPALSVCIYNLLLRRISKSYTPLEISVWAIFCATLMSLPFLPKAVTEFTAAPLSTLPVLVFLGVISHGVAFLLWSMALSITQKTSSVSNWMFVTPILTAFTSFLILSELPDFATYCGGSVILIGLILFQKFK